MGLTMGPNPRLANYRGYVPKILCGILSVWRVNTRQVFTAPHAMYRMDPGEVVERQNDAFTRTAHSAHMCFGHAKGIAHLRADLPT